MNNKDSEDYILRAAHLAANVIREVPGAKEQLEELLKNAQGRRGVGTDDDMTARAAQRMIEEKDRPHTSD